MDCSVQSQDIAWLDSMDEERQSYGVTLSEEIWSPMDMDGDVMWRLGFEEWEELTDGRGEGGR